MSGRFGRPFIETARIQNTGYDVGPIYHRAKIALITGWTYEYIDSLGLLDSETILQVYEAEQSIASSMRQRQARKPRRR